MPPKRGSKKPKVKHQTYYLPYRFRPIPLSLRPTEIDQDLELMDALLVSQRTAQRRATLAPSAAAELEPAPAPAQPLPSGYHSAAATAATAAVATYEQSVQLAALLGQQQRAAAAATATDALPRALPAAQPQHPVPAKRASPCTMQHQQMFQQQTLAGYALA